MFLHGKGFSKFVFFDQLVNSIASPEITARTDLVQIYIFHTIAGAIRPSSVVAGKMSQNSSNGISRRKIVMNQSQIALSSMVDDTDSDVWNNSDTLFSVSNQPLQKPLPETWDKA